MFTFTCSMCFLYSSFASNGKLSNGVCCPLAQIPYVTFFMWGNWSSYIGGGNVNQYNHPGKMSGSTY